MKGEGIFYRLEGWKELFPTVGDWLFVKGRFWCTICPITRKIEFGSRDKTYFSSILTFDS